MIAEPPVEQLSYENVPVAYKDDHRVEIRVAMTEVLTALFEEYPVLESSSTDYLSFRRTALVHARDGRFRGAIWLAADTGVPNDVLIAATILFTSGGNP